MLWRLQVQFCLGSPALRYRKDAMHGAVIGRHGRHRWGRAGEYARHRPEQTLLYQLIEAHYPAFIEHLAARERT